MRRTLIAIIFALCLAFTLPVFAASIKLYLKDGTVHVVREYKVEEDRVRYYSNERGDWEEIPRDLVDLARTEQEIAAHKTAIEEENKAVAAEENAEREQEREIYKIPQNPGVYQMEDGKLRTYKAAESKVHNNKRRTVLKMVAQIPLSGKATLELDGETSANIVTNDRPEFIIQLSDEERFGIVRVTAKKGVRIVAKLSIVPVVNETEEQLEEVDIFRRQLDQNLLYKIWPTKPLEPGEYAVVEYTSGKMNIQVWDFAYRPNPAK